MLKTRVITALVLMPIVLVALFIFADWAWAGFTLLIVLAACWEWSRFCQLASSWRNVYLVPTLALLAIILLVYLRGPIAGVDFAQLRFAAFALAALFWMIIVPLWLARLWKPEATWLRVVAGWLVIMPTWFALLSLRGVSPWLLLSFAAIVWVADIAAYFIGRRFGRHKLAPAISPGKTVEGAAGAVGGVMLFYFVWQYLLSHTAVRGDDWVRDLQSQGWILFALFMLLAVMSVMGDLFESWMKRGAGLKDSSNLLPGHGGILDRIDALTSTLPLAAMYVVLMSPPH